MKLKKKILKFVAVGLLVMSVAINLISCFNYKDINKATLVTSVIFDEDHLGNIIVYLDCVKPYRSANESSDKGKRIIYKGQGKTVLEAIRDINTGASTKINFTQCKAYIFTEGAANNGINRYLDIIDKDQEFTVRPYMFVLFGEPEVLLNDIEGDEEYLGVFINQLVDNMKYNPNSVVTNANDYLITKATNENTSILGALHIKKILGTDRLVLSGAAIFKDDVMVESVDSNLGLSYNFMMNNVKSGVLEVVNPQAPDSFIGLEIVKSKTKRDIEYLDGKVILKAKVKIYCSIAEAQNSFIVDEGGVQSMEALEEEHIKKQVIETFQLCKEKQLDIFNIQRDFEAKYPSVVFDKPIINFTDIDIDIDVDIQNSNNTKNTL